MKIDPIELTVEIERDPADVFEFIRDFSNEPEWQTGAIEVRPREARPAHGPHALLRIHGGAGH